MVKYLQTLKRLSQKALVGENLFRFEITEAWDTNKSELETPEPATRDCV